MEFGFTVAFKTTVGNLHSLLASLEHQPFSHLRRQSFGPFEGFEIDFDLEGGIEMVRVNC